MIIPKKTVIPVSCLVVLLLVEYLGFFTGMNNYCYDLAFRLRGPRTPPDRIVIAAVDEKTMAALGRWPLARRHYAALLERVGAADAVGFDIVMAEPSPDDALLAGAIAKQGRAVLPVVIEEPLIAVDPDRIFAKARTGHVHIERGIDGVARDVWHTLRFQGRTIPSFASVVYETATRKAFFRAPPSAGPQEPDTVGQGDGMRIDYYGGPGTFIKISFADVVRGLYPPPFFRGKIVLVGITAMGLGDSIMTPYSETRLGTAGVEVQANILANLLTGDAVTVVSPAVRFLIGAVLALGLYVLCFRTTEGQGALLLAAFLVLVSAAVFLAFAYRHVWYAPAGTCTAAVVLFVAAYVLKLDSAAASLGRTYESIRPHLRNRGATAVPAMAGRGLAGIMTPKGIQAQAALLGDITRELIFEKELSDRILLSDVFGVAVFDADGRPVIASRDVRRICDAHAISMEDRDRFAEGLVPLVMEKGGEGPAFERWLRTGAVTVSLNRPEHRYLKVDVSLLAAGEERYSLFILTDITKIKEVEILKGQIVSIVSHEMKTPMINILGFSELLVEELEGEANRYAAIIKDESERLTQFVNTFLDINRIEEGRQRIVITDVDLGVLVRDAAARMQPLAGRRDVRISVSAPEHAGTVRLDRDLTLQCVLNLTENAVKYSPKGRDVTLRVTDRPDAVVVDVIDRGYGIKGEDIGRIFEKFYRSESAAAENIKGSGLGLTFVKEAAEAQGGRVEVTSVPGQGSTFSLVFPTTAPETPPGR